MHRLTAWVLASPAWAAAQVTTSLVLPCIFEPQIIASVMTAASDATTYFLTCPPQVTTSAKGCVLDPGVIFTEGPSTVQWWQTTNDGTKTLTASLSATFKGDDAYWTLVDPFNPGGSTLSGVQRSYKTVVTPVTITAGLEKLASGAAAQATPASGLTAAASGSSSVSTKASSADVARITQNVVMAGMAAAVGGAVML